MAKASTALFAPVVRESFAGMGLLSWWAVCPACDCQFVSGSFEEAGEAVVDDASYCMWDWAWTDRGDERRASELLARLRALFYGEWHRERCSASGGQEGGSDGD